ncbi:MAG: FAD-dependent oxidoreductase [Candidatus Rickettsia vulgarisii]
MLNLILDFQDKLKKFSEFLGETQSSAAVYIDVHEKRKVVSITEAPTKFSCKASLLNILVILTIITLTTTPTFTLANPEVRYITPPRLEFKNMGKKITCYRPLRHGSPKMSIEKKYGQIIAHNYGHGGSGWTLAPGAAKYINDMLLRSEYATDLNEKTPIVVVGAGIIGLFTAYDLVKKGFSNIIIVAENFQNITSYNAGGLFAVTNMDNDSATQKTILRIAMNSYEFYSDIARNISSDFKDGARFISTYFRDRNDNKLAFWVGKVMSHPKDVILDFGNGTRRSMAAYDDSLFIDANKMMINLTRYLKGKNVKFIQQKITNFSDIDNKYVINCTGLRASALNNDYKLEGVQGHFILLKNQNPEDLEYMISVPINEDYTDHGQKIRRSFQIFPKHMAFGDVDDVGVIGGTHIEGASSLTPNEGEFNKILQGARNFYGIH